MQIFIIFYFFAAKGSKLQATREMIALGNNFALHYSAFMYINQKYYNYVVILKYLIF